jgi:WD40 repeat protein
MTVCEYSPLKGYLVVGGVEGMMFFYDMQTKIKLSQQHVHLREVLSLSFMDACHQLISISSDRHICLWDSNKLECVQ